MNNTINKHVDERGAHLKMLGRGLDLVPSFFQCAEVFMTRNEKNVIRGLHFQGEPHTQRKILTCMRGMAKVNLVNLNYDSPRIESITMVEDDQIYVEENVALGYCILESNTEMLYITDELFYPESDKGIHPFDSTLDLNWGIPEKDAILSTRDKKLPSLNEFLKE